MPSVPGYAHTPGHHCGSTALRNLLAFHGVEISEEMAFGLGAGACFYYLAIEDASPSRWFNGRTARLEENFHELTGAALELRTFEQGDGDAWAAARGGGRRRPAGPPPHRPLLPRPLRQLGPLPRPRGRPRRLRREVALLSDTGFEELQTTRLESLARARHSGHPAYPLYGHMFTVADGARPRAACEAAIPAAIERAATAMLEPHFRDFAGLPRSAASPRRPAPGPRSPRTGTGAPASATR